MLSFSTRSLVMLLVFLAAPAFAQAPSPTPTETKVELPQTLKSLSVDDYSLSNRHLFDKEDIRNDLRQFGVNPTLVVGVSVNTSWSGGDAKRKEAYKSRLVPAFKDIQKRAKSLSASGISTLVLIGKYVNAEDVFNEALQEAKAKDFMLASMSSSRLREQLPEMKFCYSLYEFQSPGVIYATNWLFMDSPGHITAIGEDLYDDGLVKLIEKSRESEAPLRKHKVCDKARSAIEVWDTQTALKQLKKLDELVQKGSIDASLYECLANRLKSIESTYDLILKGLEEKRFYVELGERLEEFKSMLKGTQREAEIRARLGELKRSPDYKTAVKAREEQRDIVRSWNETVEAPSVMISTTMTAEQQRRANLEALKKTRKQMASVEPSIDKFLKNYGDTAYAKPIKEFKAHIDQMDGDIERSS